MRSRRERTQERINSLRRVRQQLARCRAGVLAALLVALGTGLFPLTDLGERLEARTHDARFAWRGPRQSAAPIVVVALDDATVRAWQEQGSMAFWGAHYAQIARQARRAGAAWIGVDIVPAAPAEESLQGMLRRAFEQARAQGGRGTDRDLERLLAAPELLPDTQFRQAVQQGEGHVILADTVREGGVLEPGLRDLSPEAYIGFADAPRQSDDAARAAGLYLRQGDEIVPGFAALLAARVRGKDPRSQTALAALIGASDAPNVALRAFWINYTGRRFPTVSARRLADGRLTKAERRALRNAVVLVGATYGGSPDVHRVPGGGGYEAGVAVQAQALATLLDGRALRRATRAQEAVLAAGMVALLALPLVLLPFGWGLGVAAAASGIWWAAACYVFARGDYLLPTAAPLGGIALALLVGHAVRSLEEGLARSRVERVFGRYVSPTIRDFLLRGPNNLRLGGFEGEASVLFFDIRGSVAYAEKRPPLVVIAQLNELFRQVVPVLDRHGGLLYRYTGDGFLAVFGAPLPLDNHAQAACDAACAIVRVLRSAPGGSGAGSAGWRVGCGVHTGPLVYGNLGMADRSEFTVIGDTVNLAARLEGLNKEFGSEVVLSEATYSCLDAPPGPPGDMTGPQLRPVAGRQEPICVYAVHVDSPAPQPDPRAAKSAKGVIL